MYSLTLLQYIWQVTSLFVLNDAKFIIMMILNLAESFSLFFPIKQKQTLKICELYVTFKRKITPAMEL